MQDHYENIYAVISGSKTFTLRPPSHLPYMHLRACPIYQQTMLPDGSFAFAAQHSRVRWCPVDVEGIQAGGARLREQQRLFPHYFQGPPPLQVCHNVINTVQASSPRLAVAVLCAPQCKSLRLCRCRPCRLL